MKYANEYLSIISEAVEADIETSKDQEVDAEELALGIETEAEHRDLFEAMKEKFGEDFDMTEEDFFGTIAKAHLREIPDYYTRLKVMESEAKKLNEAVEEDYMHWTTEDAPESVKNIDHDDIDQETKDFIFGKKSAAEGNTLAITYEVGPWEKHRVWGGKKGAPDRFAYSPRKGGTTRRFSSVEDFLDSHMFSGMKTVREYFPVITKVREDRVHKSAEKAAQSYFAQYGTAAE